MDEEMEEELKALLEVTSQNFHAFMVTSKKEQADKLAIAMTILNAVQAEVFAFHTDNNFGRMIEGIVGTAPMIAKSALDMRRQFTLQDILSVRKIHFS